MDTAPKSSLFDEQGNALADLETTEVKRLLDAGYKLPEMFHVKADDGGASMCHLAADSTVATGKVKYPETGHRAQ